MSSEWRDGGQANVGHKGDYDVFSNAMELRFRRAELEVFWRDPERLGALISMLHLAQERFGLSPERLVDASWRLHLDLDLPSARSIRRLMGQHQRLRRADHYSSVLTVVSRLLKHDKTPLLSHPDGDAYRNLIAEHDALLFSDGGTAAPSQTNTERPRKAKAAAGSLEDRAVAQLTFDGGQPRRFICYQPSHRQDAIARSVLTVLASTSLSPYRFEHHLPTLDGSVSVVNGVVAVTDKRLFFVGSDARTDEMCALGFDMETSARWHVGVALQTDSSVAAICRPILAVTANVNTPASASVGLVAKTKTLTALSKELSVGEDELEATLWRPDVASDLRLGMLRAAPART